MIQSILLATLLSILMASASWLMGRRAQSISYVVADYDRMKVMLSLSSLLSDPSVVTAARAQNSGLEECARALENGSTCRSVDWSPWNFENAFGVHLEGFTMIRNSLQSKASLTSLGFKVAYRIACGSVVRETGQCRDQATFETRVEVASPKVKTSERHFLYPPPVDVSKLTLRSAARSVRCLSAIVADGRPPTLSHPVPGAIIQRKEKGPKGSPTAGDRILVAQCGLDYAVVGCSTVVDSFERHFIAIKSEKPKAVAPFALAFPGVTSILGADRDTHPMMNGCAIDDEERATGARIFISCCQL